MDSVKRPRFNGFSQLPALLFCSVDLRTSSRGSIAEEQVAFDRRTGWTGFIMAMETAVHRHRAEIQWNPQEALDLQGIKMKLSTSTTLARSPVMNESNFMDLFERSWRFREREVGSVEPHFFFKIFLLGTSPGRGLSPLELVAHHTLNTFDTAGPIPLSMDPYHLAPIKEQESPFGEVAQTEDDWVEVSVRIKRRDLRAMLNAMNASEPS